MPEHIIKANEFIKELRIQESKYAKEVPKRLAEIYGTDKNKRRKPDTFKDASFLYIRSYDGDIGMRPFSEVAHWRSPDINISPISQIGDFTTELEAGKSYNISTRLHNRGDVIVPYPKVEFFLTDPTLGFNTTVAKYLGVTQLPALLLPASNGEANFLYNVPITESGHKCLFARTYSFSPLDKPFDLNMLDPRLDRHIAQKNLNFVAQEISYRFNIVHQPNADETIAFVPLTIDAVHAIQHPTLRKMKIKDIRKSGLQKIIKMEFTEKTSAKLSMDADKGNWQFNTKNEKALGIAEQANLYKRTEAIIKNVHAGKTRFSVHKEELKEFREMNKVVEKTGLQIHIPDFGLKKGQAAAFDIVNVNLVNGALKGGITIVVMG